MTRTERALAAVGLMGVALFALLVVLLHDLRPNLAPTTHYISEFAVGDYAPFMVGAFVVLALAKFCIAEALRRTASSRWGPWALIIDGMAVLAVAFFSTDLPGQPTTFHGMVHNAAALVSFLASLVAFVLFTNAFRGDTRWKPDAPKFLALTTLALLAFLAFVPSTLLNVLPGLTQRIFIATILLWLALAARRAAAHV